MAGLALITPPPHCHWINPIVHSRRRRRLLSIEDCSRRSDEFRRHGSDCGSSIAHLEPPGEAVSGVDLSLEGPTAQKHLRVRASNNLGPVKIRRLPRPRAALVARRLSPGLWRVRASWGLGLGGQNIGPLQHRSEI